MNPKLALRNTHGGKGVFARVDIDSGERLAIFGGHIIPVGEEPQLSELHGDFAIQIEERFVLGALFEDELDESQFFNHSCEANAGIRGSIFLDAMRAIAAGEEITFDYAMVLHHAEDDGPYELHCILR
jgi:SET domain-containing protein